jgi:hypothetical protein
MQQTFLKRLAVLFLIFGALIASWVLMYPTTSYRFRLMLNLDTPHGPRAGSSVVEVRSVRYPAWMTFGYGHFSMNQSVKGEAALVDLGVDESGRRQVVVSLLALGPRGEAPDLFWLPQKVFEPVVNERVGPRHERPQKFIDIALELSTLPNGTRAELSGALIPTMVTFTDLKDARTAREVTPGDFERVFGKGVRLRSAFIEIVPQGIWPLNIFGIGGEPLRHNIENQLPDIIQQLRAQSREMQVTRLGDPYIARLGHFVRY